VPELEPNEREVGTTVKSSPTSPPNRRVDRRTFLGGAVAAALPALALVRRGAFGQNHASAQTGGDLLGDEATPSAAATPVSHLSDVGPDLIVTPVVHYGQLEIIEDQRPVDAGAPNQGGAVRLLLPFGSNQNFSPPSFRQDFQIMASYLDPLVWIDEVTMEALPWLAESWKVDKGGTRVTYNLRTGVDWHDGHPLTADDVVFSLLVYRDDYDSGVRNLFLNMSDVSAAGDDTVVVTLSQPDPNWLLNASSQFIMQQKQFIKHWESKPEGERTLSDFNWKKSDPIGTGPWKVAKRQDSAISFTRNDAYWAGPPHADTLTLTVQEDPAARLTSWINGETDVLWPVTAADLGTAMNQEGRLYVADTASVLFAAFNFNNPARANPALFKDLYLRQALSLALDRDRYAQEIYGGFAYPDRAGTVAQPWAHDSAAVNPKRDHAAAKKLLADAHYADSDHDGILESQDGEILALKLIVDNSANPDLLAVLDAAVSDLTEIGVGLEIQALPIDQFNDIWINTHEFDLIAYSYNLYPGFTDFDLYGSEWDIRLNPQGWNPGGYSNIDVDRWVRDMLEVDNQADYVKQLHALQKETNKDLFGLWFGFPRDLVLVRDGIRGFQPNKQWQTWDTRKLWKR
jgi:peptide/nickel transport system substrate-binding protein